MAPRRAYAQPQAGRDGFARTKKVYGNPINTISLVAADVALNGQVSVLRIPRDFIVQSMNATFGACDSGATLSMSIGDLANNARFAAASTTPRAGGTINLLPAAVNYQFPDDTDVVLTTTAGAAGLGATPTVLITMEGFTGS